MRTGVFDLHRQELVLLEEVWKQYVHSGLRFGWKSNTKAEYDYGHWNKQILTGSKIFPYDQDKMPYMDYHPAIQKIWAIIQETIGERALLRVYVNGYTYGTDGYFHKDDTWITSRFGAGTLSETIIVYLNQEWDRDWAGETVLIDDNDEIAHAVLPKFGRVFVFDSNVWHAARPVTRSCPALRSVLVFKTMSQTISSQEISFILEKTRGISHSGKTFFEHLYNTFSLLEKNDHSQDVCVAGLFHSVYGTESFEQGVVSPKERSVIQDMIGTYAERLVYEFCTMQNRFQTIISNSKNYEMSFRRDLMLIECANLIEQNNHVNRDDQIQKLNDEISVLETDPK